MYKRRNVKLFIVQHIMMHKNYLILLVLPFLVFEVAVAKNIIDCRVMTIGAIECNPYGSKLIWAKEINHELDTKKLIISKTLPILERKALTKVISVEDMIEKYVKVEDSLRFQGSVKSPLNVVVVEEPFTEEEIRQLEETEEIEYGQYSIVRNDELSKISQIFGLTTRELLFLNGLKKDAIIHIGQKLNIPLSQKMIDALVDAKYTVEFGDSLISIANKFSISPKSLAEFNKIKTSTAISVGKTILLPLPHILEKIEVEKKAEIKKRKRVIEKEKSQKAKMISDFGQRKLRVTATAYTSHVEQTNKSPFMAAWGNRLKPGMKIIAVSRDMLSKYNMRNGSEVRIGGLPGYYKVRDKMNKRYKKRIDIYMGTDRKKALRWGRRSVVISW